MSARQRSVVYFSRKRSGLKSFLNTNGRLRSVVCTLRISSLAKKEQERPTKFIKIHIHARRCMHVNLATTYIQVLFVVVFDGLARFFRTFSRCRSKALAPHIRSDITVQSHIPGAAMHSLSRSLFRPTSPACCNPEEHCFLDTRRRELSFVVIARRLPRVPRCCRASAC